MLSVKSRIQNWIYTVIATIENWLCMQTRLGKKNMENTSDQFVKEKCIEGVSFKKSCPPYKVIVEFSKLLKLSQGWNFFFFFSWIECFHVIDDELNYQDIEKIGCML